MMVRVSESGQIEMAQAANFSRGAMTAEMGLFPDEGVAHVARRAGASVAG